MIDVPLWSELLNEVVHSPMEDVEPGFVTRDELAETMRIANGGGLSRKLKWLVKQGKLEEKTFRTRDSKGRAYPLLHYRPIRPSSGSGVSKQRKP